MEMVTFFFNHLFLIVSKAQRNVKYKYPFQTLLQSEQTKIRQLPQSSNNLNYSEVHGKQHSRRPDNLIFILIH